MGFFDRDVVVSTGQSISSACFINKGTLIGFCLPANIDSATSITFQTRNPTTGEFADLHDDTGQEVKITVAAGKHVAADSLSRALAPWDAIKVRLGTAAVPVVATAERKITIVIKE